MQRRTARVIRAGSGVAVMVALVIPALSTAQAGQQPLGTLVVSDTTVEVGQTITVSNADEDASRCEGGIAVVFVGGAPAGINQLVLEPDENGDWSTEWTVPDPADYPSQSVGGPFVFSGLCDSVTAPTDAAPAAAPPFEYAEVTVTVVDAPTVPTAPADPPAAEPEVVAPTLTG